MELKQDCRILIITSGVTAGGVDSLVLNVLSERPSTRWKIDILIFDDSKDDWAYKFEEYGCRILKVDRARKQGAFRAIKSYHKIIKDGGYDIVHSHIGFGSVLPLIASTYVKGVKAICHAHFDEYEDTKFTKIVGHLLFNVLPCERLACSHGAGVALYGKRSKFSFVKNGIDSNKFAFDKKIRMKVREKLGIEDGTFVVGTVGRMDYQKNHEFLVRIFDEIKKTKSDSKLLLIGDGGLHQKIEEQIDSLNLSSAVEFLGIRTDVNELLQALDVFIMPTRFEGLSLALLEVECSGLPCLTSDVVPKEVKVVEEFEFISLNRTAKDWANIALGYAEFPRSDKSGVIVENGFDKRGAAEEWFNTYSSALNV